MFMKNFRNVLWGIVLIIIGVIIGGNTLGIFNIDIFFDGWWTLFIIVPCFIGLFTEREKTGNLIGLLVGIALLAAAQGFFDFEIIWKLALPLILIIIGLSFIFKDTFNKNVSEKIKELNKKQAKNDGYCATFSGQKARFDGEKFNGTDLTAIFGGVECDLRNAIIENDVVINASSIFGGIDIFVPENVKVKIKSTAIFGGVEEKNPKKVENSEAHTIYVNALCMFGGVEIK